MNDAFRAKLAAELGLDPGADEDAITSAAKALRIPAHDRRGGRSVPHCR